MNSPKLNENVLVKLSNFKIFALDHRCYILRQYLNLLTDVCIQILSIFFFHLFGYYDQLNDAF